jgi:hypothetical protein
MRDSLFVLGTAAVAVVCCLGVSLLAAAGGSAVLGLAGVALPVAALLGAAGWTGWYLVRRRRTP